MIPENRPPTHPGEMLLEEFLRPLGMTQAEAARRMEIPRQALVTDHAADARNTHRRL